MRWDHLGLAGMALAAASCDGSEAASDALLTADGTDTEPTTGAGDTDSEETPPEDSPTPVEPAWWSIDAEILVAQGAVDEGDSTWLVSLWGEDVTALPCVFEVPVLDAASQAPPAVEAGTLVGWWTVSFGDGPALPDCPEWPASDLSFGFGPYDARLDAASDAHAWLGLDLYGLYLQLDPTEPVLSIGVAGTQDQFEGAAGVVVGPPLPDGTYAAATLILLAM